MSSEVKKVACQSQTVLLRNGWGGEELHRVSGEPVRAKPLAADIIFSPDLKGKLGHFGLWLIVTEWRETSEGEGFFLNLLVSAKRTFSGLYVAQD